MLRRLLVSLSILGISQTMSAETLNAYFERLKQSPNALVSFLKAMPKGGELHYHLAGGAYPETMATIALQNNYCLQPTSQNLIAGSMGASHCPGSSLPLKDFAAQQGALPALVGAWSMKDYFPGKESAHDHFFNTFEKFMPIVIDHSPALLAEVIQRAADQHENYLEVMILPDNAASLGFNVNSMDNQLPLERENFDALKQDLLKQDNFQRNIQQAVENTEKLFKETREQLGCALHPEKPVCELNVKFQYYVLREQPWEKVFTQALTAFEAVSRSKLLVGVNLVQPEDGLMALNQYHQHMRVFAFMHRSYPKVNLALHAGELAMGQVVPYYLQFHIDEAVNVAGAQRIGHGVDIAYETNAEQILKKMAQTRIPVEINLTSNAIILDVSKRQHPLNNYLDHKVPVVLSTDDEGILRTDLTQEYVKAALDQGLSYSALKQINRNALTYSFLPGKSLWSEPSLAEPVKQCHDLKSHACLVFIKDNEKAQLQWKLENQLREFESKLHL